MISRETEIKIDLGAEGNYLRLLTALKAVDKTSRQENYFFDTADFQLGQTGWAIRIRIEGDSASLTLKGPAENNITGLAVRPELIRALTVDKALMYVEEGIKSKELPDNFTQYLPAGSQNNTIQVMASFVNYRATVAFPSEGNLVLEIDKTAFGEKEVDYELEVELPDKDKYVEAMNVLTGLLKRLDIPLKMQSESKLARALRYRRERNNPPVV